MADFQTHTAVVAERERALEARRACLQELREQVGKLHVENQSREDALRQERARYEQKKTLQDAKLSAKEAQASAQQERLQALAAEEERLANALRDCNAKLQTSMAEVEHRQELEVSLRDARSRLTDLKLQLEDRDAKVMRLETKAARLEVSTERRHGAVAERVPQQWLPRVVSTVPGHGLEDTAAESVLLVEERAL